MLTLATDKAVDPVTLAMPMALAEVQVVLVALAEVQVALVVLAEDLEAREVLVVDPLTWEIMGTAVLESQIQDLSPTVTSNT